MLKTNYVNIGFTRALSSEDMRRGSSRSVAFGAQRPQEKTSMLLSAGLCAPSGETSRQPLLKLRIKPSSPILTTVNHNLSGEPPTFQTKPRTKKKVVVAMSGGVDSSVAAALLLSEGYSVIGVTMRIWSDEDCERESSRSCCSRNDIEDAQRVAEKLKIPFYVLNFKDEFEREVIDYFCREYLKGFTPNPCIICNEKIKFGVLLRKAKMLGADFVATGHYCRIMYDERRKRFRLFEAYDKKKNQSYCLFSLRQEQLSSILMPIGEYSKKRVREIAKKFNLKVYDKVDSQEICFVRNNDYRNLLQEKLKKKIKPGLIVDIKGKILGEHKGICFFTVGQRKGLGIARGKPSYVVSIDSKRNLVVVGDEEDVKKREFIAGRLNWIGVEGINGKRQKVEAKIRYAQAKSEAIIEDTGKDSVRVKFLKPQSAITPGQAVVFYQGEEVLGGGWIEKAQSSKLKAQS